MSHAKVPALRLSRARSGQADGSEPISPIATPTARSSRRTGRKRGREAGEDKGPAAEKRKVAERRRFLRDQRMETIHYPELIERLKTLVEDHAPTDSEISELYQVRPLARGHELREELLLVGAVDGTAAEVFVGAPRRPEAVGQQVRPRGREPRPFPASRPAR